MSDKAKVVALGYFDSVHIGHQKVIKTAEALSYSKGAALTVFSFDGNLKKALGNADGCNVFTTKERKAIFKQIGIKNAQFAPTTKEFLSLTPTEFLDFINSFGTVVAYVCGEDYRFGRNGVGDVEFLKSYANKNGQEVVTVPMIDQDGEKVSTTRIKRLLLDGEIERANKLLGRSYFVTGKVERGRKVGEKLGFPTANVRIKKDKITLKNGVYAGRCLVDDKEYLAMINYGAKPTFSLSDLSIEAHLIGYEGDLYGKTVTLFIDGFLREIIKFASAEKLKEQLKKDLKNTKDRKYD
ncbi:MAG: riboflavin biosynthesis protein RibF [Clostridia bacterium]|nr:riboflavin biosynthesis protein RibF [Clostridia bacterium]